MEKTGEKIPEGEDLALSEQKMLFSLQQIQVTMNHHVKKKQWQKDKDLKKKRKLTFTILGHKKHFGKR